MGIKFHFLRYSWLAGSCLFLALGLTINAPLATAADDATLAPSVQGQWIWIGPQEDGSKSAYRRAFKIDGAFKSAQVVATADNHCVLYLNGEKILSGDDWNNLEVADVTKQLKQGRNVLAVEGRNDGGIAAVYVQLRVVTEDGKNLDLATDKNWQASAMPTGKWQAADYDDSKWTAPNEVGALGQGSLPWSGSINVDTVAASLGSKVGGDFIPQVATNITAPEGFLVERIYHVPRSQGSWVSLTEDDKGRLIACDQGGQGLYLITPGRDGMPTKVEHLPAKLSGAQGLCWAFDALYAVVNGGGQSGLHRLKDTDGDGLIDSDEHLMHVPGGGEHGPHAVILSPDDKSLYICAGNHTDLPKEISGSRLPQNWSEDHLLPRRWDANGHAAGKLAPGGWICKVDPDGKSWEVVSSGFRNEYDIAFNADGELFAYDADMEWDLGSPWYRPTRVNHATSGSEFGWRSGTGKWPAYYEDSLPAVVDIGPGSPVGVAFGYGAKFPAKYQTALFILDWTYSTIYSVHMHPEGSTYKGTKEDFLVGQPMPVTDAVVGKDGALYFAVGGRGTQSEVYRVTYTGSESTAPVDAKTTAGADLRQLRHELEAFHGRSDGDLEKIFANLGHEDRFIRYAARVALENQPVDSWRSRALAVKEPRALINGMIALSRQGKPEDADAVRKALASIDFASLEKQTQLAALRAWELSFTRLGEPNDAGRAAATEYLDPLYPAKANELNAELVQLLVYLRAPTVVAKTFDVMDNLGKEPIPDWSGLEKRNAGYGGTVARMLEDMPPSRGIHYEFMLRNVKEPWTLEQRRRYFEFFLEAAKHPGGSSYPGFLAQMRDDALANIPTAERIVLDDIASRSLKDDFQATPPKGPGQKWTKDEVLALLEKPLHGQNYEQGRNLFHATSCAKCHRFNGEGGAIGPDLSTAGRKFNLPDLVDALVDPSKAISDQYGSFQVLTTGGDSLLGRVVEIGDQVYVYTLDPNAPPKVMKKTEVEEMRPSKVSQMPEGLLNPLSPSEVKQLVAYILSAGNRKADVYKGK